MKIIDFKISNAFRHMKASAWLRAEGEPRQEPRMSKISSANARVRFRRFRIVSMQYAVTSKRPKGDEEPRGTSTAKGASSQARRNDAGFG